LIGLPGSVRASLFDLDGVLTRTATVHAAAWKEMFDGYLRERAARTGEEFDPVADYDKYVDGKPRYDGVRSFLAGVAAGRAGGFAYAVGVDRVGQANGLRGRGASIVVSDLSELLEDR
jgi:beta-phosphoglucomutase-like phosphatase (HAD superfamily)